MHPLGGSDGSCAWVPATPVAGQTDSCCPLWPGQALAFVSNCGTRRSKSYVSSVSFSSKEWDGDFSDVGRGKNYEHVQMDGAAGV